MGTVLFTLELGAGIGHLMMIMPIVKALRADGHRVILATKDVAAAHRILGNTGIEFLGTPRSQFPLPFPQQHTFAHLMANIGFGSASVLESHVASWRTLYRTLQPDLIVFANSPVAMLAAIGTTARRALICSGFFIPPDAYPLPAFRPELKLDWKSINAVEDEMLERINIVLRASDHPPLERFAQLFTQCDEVFLATYPELDHFPNRQNTKYWGTVNGGDIDGKDPVWPEGPGQKIFAYLRPFPGLPHLLQVLTDSKQPTLVFAIGLDSEICNRFASRTLRFEKERMDISKVATQCDLAVTYAGLATMALILNAGKPVLLIPMTEEQGILARLIHLHGAGLGVLPDQSSEFGPRLKLVLDDPRYRQSAARLAEQMRRIDLEQSQTEIIRRLHAMIV